MQFEEFREQVVGLGHQQASQDDDGRTAGPARGCSAGRTETPPGPPVCDTGVSPVNPGLTVSLHYVAFTSRAGVEVVKAAVNRFVLGLDEAAGEGPWQEIDYGSQGYQRQLIAWEGVRILYTPGREDVHAIIPGKGCEQADADKLWLMLQARDIRLKRIDLAIDGAEDEGEPLCPRKVYELCRDRHDTEVRSWVQFNKRKANGDPVENLVFHESRAGQTCAIGARSSDRFLRIYDRRGLTRIELELKHDRAERFQELIQGKRLDQLPRLAVAVIRDMIEFVQPSKDKSRAPLQAWWAAIVMGIEKIRLKIPEKIVHVAKTWHWLYRQVSGALYTLLQASGGDESFLGILYDQGKRVYGPRHAAVLATAGGAGGWVAPVLAAVT